MPLTKQLLLVEYSQFNALIVYNFHFNLSQSVETQDNKTEFIDCATATSSEPRHSEFFSNIYKYSLVGLSEQAFPGPASHPQAVGVCPHACTYFGIFRPDRACSRSSELINVLSACRISRRCRCVPHQMPSTHSHSRMAACVLLSITAIICAAASVRACLPARWLAVRNKRAGRCGRRGWNMLIRSACMRWENCSLKMCIV